MKPLLILLLIFVFLLPPLAAESHPGKTDRYGGHLCIKECEEWNLLYKEYHLHDKDGKPVRIRKERRRKRVEPVFREVQTLPAVTAVQPDPPKSSVVTTYHYAANVSEERSLLSNPLLFVLIALLILLLVFRMNKRREEG